MPKCVHDLCNAHHVRELTRVHDECRPAARLAGNPRGEIHTSWQDLLQAPGCQGDDSCIDTDCRPSRSSAWPRCADGGRWRPRIGLPILSAWSCPIRPAAPRMSRRNC
ncbi:hypothetical protein [Verminephrobacter eiseniae]|uniref:hypothetical protein n=1 Tax=Verminephrobacter eiseniae TaxID=364317 RepID=UPI0038B417EA